MEPWQWYEREAREERRERSIERRERFGEPVTKSNVPEYTINPFEVGEWDEDGDGGSGSIYVWAGNQEKFIAEVSAQDVPECEAIANATLFAASQRLLAACKAAIADGPHNAGYGLSCHVLRELREAVAAAEVAK